MWMGGCDGGDQRGWGDEGFTRQVLASRGSYTSQHLPNPSTGRGRASAVGPSGLLLFLTALWGPIS